MTTCLKLRSENWIASVILGFGMFVLVVDLLSWRIIFKLLKLIPVKWLLILSLPIFLTQGES